MRVAKTEVGNPEGSLANDFVGTVKSLITMQERVRRMKISFMCIVQIILTKRGRCCGVQI